MLAEAKSYFPWDCALTQLYNCFTWVAALFPRENAFTSANTALNQTSEPRETITATEADGVHVRSSSLGTSTDTNDWIIDNNARMGTSEPWCSC